MTGQLNASKYMGLGYCSEINRKQREGGEEKLHLILNMKP
jgi:hypothetical protein